jgi:hypothetical protein
VKAVLNKDFTVFGDAWIEWKRNQQKEHNAEGTERIVTRKKKKTVQHGWIFSLVRITKLFRALSCNGVHVA